MGLVVAREPDFVHAVIERDDAIGRHRLAHFGDQPLRINREAIVICADQQIGFRRAPDGLDAAKIPAALGGNVLVDLPDRVSDIADHLNLREIDRVDFGRTKVDVNDLRTAGLHEERRLLDHIVSDINDHIGGLDRAVHEIAGGQRRVADELRMPLIDHPFAELSGDEGQASMFDELQQHARSDFAIRAGANNENGRARTLDSGHRRPDGFIFRYRAARYAARDRKGVRVLLGNVLRELQVNRTRLLFLGEAERLAHP